MCIVIVDYGMGNLRSVQKALHRMNISAKISNSEKEILTANKILLPGVGHFKKAMENMKNLGLDKILQEAVILSNTPIIGICLGMQLMTEYSEEGDVAGLGWIKGKTVKFNQKQFNLKYPHIGWNTLIIRKDKQSLFVNIPNRAFYYFVHSYYVTCQSKDDIITETEYGEKFVSTFIHNNIYGCQYHPEKSHDAGLKILKNFSDL